MGLRFRFGATVEYLGIYKSDRLVGNCPQFGGSFTLVA